MSNLRTPNISSTFDTNPFDLDDDRGFQSWCEQKLDQYPQSVADLMVEVDDPLSLTRNERFEIIHRCDKSNMAFYFYRKGDIGSKTTLRRFGEQLGLKDMDGNLCADNDRISSVQVMSTGRQLGYIPYSNRPLNWHSDGYYNQSNHRIFAFIIHCVRNAESGGDNAFMDPEIAYALLRRENPKYVTALMEPDVMTIPANIENGKKIREAQTGPVYSLNHDSNRLHMRYTARRYHIEWKQEQIVSDALKYIADLFSEESIYIIRHRFTPGQGVVCNNVLHNRSGFKDSDEPELARLLYRTRYHQRVADN